MANDQPHRLEHIKLLRKLDAIGEAFEAAWQSGERPTIETLIQQHPTIPKDRLIQELVELEIELRLKTGELPTCEEYLSRFSGLNRNWLAGLLDNVSGLPQILPPDSARDDAALLTTPLPLDESEQPTLAPLSAKRASVKFSSFGDYKILEEIARGGMGVVYKARQLSLNRTVALKMILSGRLASDEEIQRFRGEAESAANLEHPGIVPIYEVGEHDGHQYFSMGFVEGENLQSMLIDGPLPAKEAAALTGKISDAIAYAHKKGVIHRDLKPANILIENAGNPKVTDFGLAKNLRGDSDLTDTGQILGTPSFMPPEQAAGETAEVDERADVYALGAILYFTLVNRPPFQASTPIQTLKQVLEGEPVAPRSLDPTVPKDIETICLKCLQKEPNRRYENVHELIEDLNRYLSYQPIKARPVSRSEKAWLWCKRRPSIVGAILAVALVVALSTSAILWQRAESKRIRLVEQVESAVNALESGSGNAVPFILSSMRSLPESLVQEELNSRWSEVQGLRKLNLAYGLARLSDEEIEVVVSALAGDEIEPDEIDNIVAALRGYKREAIKAIQSATSEASNASNWPIKARLAIVAMHLGDPAMAAEMLRFQPESMTPKVELPDPREMIEEIHRVPEAERNSSGQQYRLATFHYVLNEYDQALAELEPSISGDSADWRMWFMHTICQAALGSSADANQSFEKLKTIIPNQLDESVIPRTDILVESWLGNFEEAEKKLNDMLASFPLAETNAVATVDSESSEDRILRLRNAAKHYSLATFTAQLVQVYRQKSAPGEPRLKKQTYDRLRLAYTAGYNGFLGHIDEAWEFCSVHQDEEFLALVKDLKPPEIHFDPIQRTVFIQEFPSWSGSIEPLAEQLADVEDAALRSGICLSLSQIPKPGQVAQENWQPVLSGWYRQSPDGGTHSAAYLALSRWNLPVPQLAPSLQAPTDRDWWHEPNGLTMTRIHSGKNSRDKYDFTVGNSIEVAHDFWLSDAEVTVGLFRKFIFDQEYRQLHPEMKLSWDGEEGTRGSQPKIPHDELPVDFINWYDAVLFCNWLSWKLELERCYDINKIDPTEFESNSVAGENAGSTPARRPPPFSVSLRPDADGFRLPDLAEWEFARLAGATTSYCIGNEKNALLDYGWFTTNSGEHIHSIRTKLCNPWGLFDMRGNVSEWIWYGGGAKDGMTLGGQYSHHPPGMTRRVREDYKIDQPQGTGFRVARGYPQPSPESE